MQQVWETDPYVTAYPEMHEFWRASSEGIFLLRTCTACARAHWYPRVVCPLCGSTATAWQPASGRATLFAFTESPRDDDSGLLAYVTLAEGPRMLTRVLGHTAMLRIGQALQATVAQIPSGRTVPIFEPLTS